MIINKTLKKMFNLKNYSSGLKRNTRSFNQYFSFAKVNNRLFTTCLPFNENSSKKHLLSSQQANKLIMPKLKHLSSSVKYNENDVNLNISHSHYSIGNNQYLFNVALNATSEVVKPAIFICALDVSGSMNSTSSNKSDLEESKFSRLDLVKHSMNTIIHCLRPQDSLAMITFSDLGSKELSLINMDENGKRMALKSLQQFQPSGQTNLWDGLKISLEEIEKNYKLKNVNKFTLLLSDGECNINPIKGVFNEFQNRNLEFPIKTGLHTFGYGYDLDSDLLLKLSNRGGGLFAHMIILCVTRHLLTF